MAFLNTLKAYILLCLQIARSFGNLYYGIWQLSKLPQAPITIFGGGSIKPHSNYMLQGKELAQLLIKADIPIIASECPGFLEDINCQPIRRRRLSTLGKIVIKVKGKPPKHLTIYRFFARKWLLINYSTGFVVFPGGLGTMGELTQVLTLIQTHKRLNAPIILIGTDFWAPFVTWLHKSALSNGLITKEEAALFTLTDNIQQAYTLLCKIEKKQITVI